jgi:hypothetical protein
VLAEESVKLSLETAAIGLLSPFLWNIPWSTVLAYATAHEVGHLLLGADGHTPMGVMKADWGRADHESTNQHQLHFDKQQLIQLASRFGDRSTGPRIKTALE